MSFYTPKPPQFKPRPPTKGQRSTNPSTNRAAVLESYNQSGGSSPNSNKGGKGGNKGPDKGTGGSGGGKSKSEKRRLIIDAWTPGAFILSMGETATTETLAGRTVTETNTTYPTGLTGTDAKWGVAGVSGSSTTDTQFVDGLSVAPLNTTDFKYSGDFTMEFWYRYDNGPTHPAVQPWWTITGGVVDQTIDADNRGYVIYMTSGKATCRLIGDTGIYAGTGHQIDSPTNLVFQDYTHVVMCREGTTVKLGSGGTWGTAANSGTYNKWLDTFGVDDLGVAVGYGKTITNVAAFVDFESYKPGQPFAQCIDGVRFTPRAVYSTSGSTYTVPTEFWTGA